METRRMTYYEFINQLAQSIGIDGKQVIWVIPSGINPNRPTAFELFFDGIKEGRPMKISKIVTERDAPLIFTAFFAQLTN